MLIEERSFTVALRHEGNRANLPSALVAEPPCGVQGGLVVQDGATVSLSGHDSLQKAIQSAEKLVHHGFLGDASGVLFAASAAIVSRSNVGVSGLDRGPSASENLAASLAFAAHPGQILVCPQTAELIAVSEQVGNVVSLGVHVLEADLPEGEVFQWNRLSPHNPFPPIRSLYPVRHNLPQRVFPFFGRSEEVCVLRDLLRVSNCVTLTGPTGIGKSGLAWRYGVERTSEYPGGVWVLEVEPSDTFGTLLAKLSALLDLELPLAEDADAFPQVQGPLLIILEGCDRAPAASRVTFEGLRSGIPNLEILATSKLPLEVSGETQFRVVGLQAPVLGDFSASDVLDYDGPRLLWDRVLLIDSARELTDEVANELVEICQRLGGFPASILAVATPYVRYGIEAIRGTWNRYESHVASASVASAIASSYDGLGPQARHFLSGLSVFAADCPLSAAQEVAAVEGAEDCFVWLRELVESGLIEIGISHNREFRFAVSPTAASYVASLPSLCANRSDAILRHLRYYAALAESKAEEIVKEMSNIRLALSRSLEQDDPELGLRLILALGPVWHRKGPHREAADLCGRVCRRARASAHSLLPRALNLLGTFKVLIAELEAAVTAHEEAHKLAIEGKDPVTAAMALANLALVHKHRRDLPAARAIAELAVSSFRSIGDEKRLGTCLTNYGAVLEDLREHEEAKRTLEEAIALFERLGDGWSASRARFNIAEMALNGGSFDEAKALYFDSLERARDIGDPVLAALSLEGLCFAEIPSGRADFAALALGAAKGIRAAGCAAISTIQAERIEFAQKSLQDRIGAARLDAQIQSAGSLRLDEAVDLIRCAI